MHSSSLHSSGRRRIQSLAGKDSFASKACKACFRPTVGTPESAQAVSGIEVVEECAHQDSRAPEMSAHRTFGSSDIMAESRKSGATTGAVIRSG